MSPEDFLTLLDAIPQTLEDMEFREPLREITSDVGDEVGQNFQRQVGADSSPWPPHAPLTVKLYGPHPLLRLSLAMYGAATDPAGPGGKLLLEDRQVTFGIDGTEIPYAKVQNEGGVGEGGNTIPQREFFYLTDEAEKKVGETFAGLVGPLVRRELLK